MRVSGRNFRLKDNASIAGKEDRNKKRKTKSNEPSTAEPASLMARYPVLLVLLCCWPTMENHRFSPGIGHIDRMVRISRSSLSEFLSRRPFSIVHVDANWDGYRKALGDKICDVEPQFEQSVSFGYVDCDEEQAFAGEIGIVNV